MEVTARPTIVVAGLGRCGSSLTMQMLSAGSVPCVGKPPDFEDERTSALSFDADWFDSLGGVAVKLLDAQRIPLRPFSNHVVIWLDRDPREQARSMLKMASLALPNVDRGRRGVRLVAKSIERDRELALARLLGTTPHAALRLDFEDLVCAPSGTAARLAAFLRPHGHKVDLAPMGKVAKVRPLTCLPGLLEEWLMVEAAR